MRNIKLMFAMSMTWLLCWSSIVQPLAVYASTSQRGSSAVDAASSSASGEDPALVDLTTTNEKPQTDSSLGNSSEDVVLASVEEEGASQQDEMMEEGSSSQVDARPDHRENSWRYCDGESIGGGEVERSQPFSMDMLPEGATAQGIDVSEHQGVIDWEAVKSAGIDFAIIRLGFSYPEDGGRADKQWNRNVAECERLGIPYGVYVYSYASDAGYARREADFALQLLAGHAPQLPIYFDMEDNNLIGGDYAGMAQAFCGRMEDAGYDAGVYANLNWWNSNLTDSIFNTWDRWVAQYNVQCDYAGQYSTWQYSSKGSVPGISGNVDLNWSYSSFFSENVDDDGSQHVSYRSHVANIGWQKWRKDGEQSGTVGLNKSIESLEIRIENPAVSGDIELRSHVSDIGWQGWSNASTGTTGKSLQMEAIQLRLTGELANTFDLYYRVHSDIFGWLGWAKNGESAGSVGFARGMQAIQIQLVKKGGPAPGATEGAFQSKPMSFAYRAHVQDIGWQRQVTSGATAGTVGRSLPMEALSVSLVNAGPDDAIELKGHVSNLGWQDWQKCFAGTTGRALPLEAVQIRLSEAFARSYDIYYRVHVSGIGWMAWAKNGESSGTQGYSVSIEAVQIRLVEKGGSAPDSSGSVTADAFRRRPISVSYSAHVSDIGWMPVVESGVTAGTTGRSLPVEALRVSLSNAWEGEGGSVLLCAHVSDVGWTDWSTGVAGTTGQRRRMEAFKAKLSGDVAAKYDLYYRAHCSDLGWLGWAKNGEPAGTESLSCPIEAVEFRLVKKGGDAPGDDGAAFIKAPVGSLRVNAAGAWQSAVSFGAVSGAAGRGEPIYAFILDLESAPFGGSVTYRAHCANTGWQESVKEGMVAGDTSAKNAVQAIQISLTDELSKIFDVWYRVYIDEIGWLGWTKNGQSAGTVSCSLSVQAVQVTMRVKNAKAPGSTSGAYFSSVDSLPYVGFQNPVGYPQVSNKTVRLPGYCAGKFSYVTPSRIPYNATRDQCVEAFVTRAYEYIGTRYIEPWSCAPGDAVDCSGLVLQCLYATGMDMGWYNPYNHRWLPEQTYNSMNWYRNKTFLSVSISSMMRGDLVYYNGHVAIYLGNGQIIDSWPRIGVTVRNLYAPGSPIGAARPFVC